MVLEWFLCRQKYENENDDTSITRKQALQLGHICSDVIRIQAGRQGVYRLAYRAYALNNYIVMIFTHAIGRIEEKSAKRTRNKKFETINYELFFLPLHLVKPRWRNR